MATATSAWTKPGAWALESEQLAAMEISEPSPDFPSLATAAASKSSKKKKPQSLSLAEFTHGAATSDETRFLPTGPRERSAEELDRSSRGFSYSKSSRVNGDERNSLNRDSAPSRADEVEDWGSMKRSGGVSERRERGGGFFDSQSRADEVDSWVLKKSMVKERSVGCDTWGRKKDEISRADSDTWGRKREEVNGGGGGRPRLLLQPRTVPLVNENVEGNGEVHQVEKCASIGNSKGLNPFGLARPREEVLAEKGWDWKKLDEKLESAKMRERITDEVCSGRNGRRLGNGSLAEDCAEKSWRKEVASDALASMKEDQTEASLLN